MRDMVLSTKRTGLSLDFVYYQVLNLKNPEFITQFYTQNRERINVCSIWTCEGVYGSMNGSAQVQGCVMMGDGG